LKYEDLPQKSLLRPDEVAEFLSINEDTVYRYVDAGILTGTKVTGKMLRVYRKSVIAMVEAGRTDRAEIIETRKTRRTISKGIV